MTPFIDLALTNTFLEKEEDEVPKKTNNNSPSLRSRDAAHLLDCSPDDVMHWARAGKLNATKDGRFWRFNKTDVLRYKKILDKEASS